MRYVSGLIYQGREFKSGYLGFEEGFIKETGRGPRKESEAKGIIIPTFVNAHTHIGDAVITQEISGSLEEVMAPPDGLKHRILRTTPKETIISSMRRNAKSMLSCGIEHFCDFREGGAEGVRLLSEALSQSPIKPKIFGRPKDLKYDKEEMDELLKLVDGIGLSSISDWDEGQIKAVAKHTKSKQKPFALHASERVREDIDSVLDLKPDFLIHMNKATDSDLKICAQNDIPVVICPRAEVFFGNAPDIPRMVNSGVTLALGTDNAMLNSPGSLLREMEFAYKISRLTGKTAALDILNMVLINSRKVLNAGYDICLTQGTEANFIVFELPKKDPAHALVNFACAQNISLISINKHIITNM